MKLLTRILLWLATVGWLVPAHIGIENYMGYQRVEVQAFIWHGKEAPVTSWPYLGVAESSFRFSFIWFACVFAAWSLFLIMRSKRKKMSRDPQAPIQPPVPTRRNGA